MGSGGDEEGASPAARVVGAPLGPPAGKASQGLMGMWFPNPWTSDPGPMSAVQLGN